MNDVTNSDEKVQDREEGKRRKYTLGETIDLLGTRDWDILIDLYKIRCLPISYALNTYFVEDPGKFYDGYETASEGERKVLEEKNRKRAYLKCQRAFTRFNQRGLMESIKVHKDSVDLPNDKRSSVLGETWFYLSYHGNRIVEERLAIPDEAKVSKLELDMSRANKKHLWELGKVYLEIKYQWEGLNDVDWDWYLEHTLSSDHEEVTLRPDAIFRIEDQLLFIEMDRSTEIIYRDPGLTPQTSIREKLKKYHNLFRLSSNEVIRSGLVIFIVPEAKHDTRLRNIRATAENIFTETNPVIVGRSLKEAFAQIDS